MRAPPCFVPSAELIAAAPDMYKALSELLRCFEQMSKSGPISFAALDEASVALDLAYDALAKARGEA